MYTTAMTLGVLGAPVVALGAGLPDKIVPCTGALGAHPCGVCDIAQLAQNVLNTGIYIAIFFSAILFAYAGWETLTSGGNSEQYQKGVKIFSSVVIGLVIILAGWLLVDTLMKTLTNGSFGLLNMVCDCLFSAIYHFYA